jgi:hypothetical protein
VAFQEPGADVVLSRLRGSLLSVANYQEVLEKIQERQFSTEHALSGIQGMRILIVDYAGLIPRQYQSGENDRRGC